MENNKPTYMGAIEGKVAKPTTKTIVGKSQRERQQLRWSFMLEKFMSINKGTLTNIRRFSLITSSQRRL